MERRLERLKGAGYLKALDSGRIYSPREIVNNAVEKGIFEPDDDLEKAVVRFRVNAKELNHPGDGKVTGANGRMVDGYFGARWKLLLPESELSYEGWRGCQVVLEELTGDAPSPQPVHANTAILAKLNLVEGRLNEVQRHLTLMKNLGGVIPALKWLMKTRWRKGSLAAVAGLLFMAFAWQRDESLFLPQVQSNRIAILFCEQDTAVLPYAVSKALSAAPELSALPLARSARIAEKFDVCQRPDEDTLAAIAAELHAPLLLWGGFSQDRNGRSFSGLLYQENIGAVDIRVSSRDGLHLPDVIAEECFAELGVFTKQPLSTVHFHSRNESANLIYSEAQLLYEEGDIASALKLFRRATVFDPDFLLAHIRFARCLTLTGQYVSAAEALERVEDNADLPNDLKLRMYLDSINNLYKMQRYEELEATLVSALSLRDVGDPKYFSIVLDIAARVAHVRQQPKKRAAFVDQLQELVSLAPLDHALYIRLLRLQAFFAEDDDPAQSVAFLISALSRAKEHDLPNEHYNLLYELTKVAIKYRLPEMATARDEITEAEPYLTEILGEINTYKCRYLLGQLQLHLGEPIRGEINLVEAIPPLANAGHVDFVANARLHLVQLYLDQKRYFEAHAMLGYLENRLNDLAPSTQLTVLDRSFRLAYFEDNLNTAIAKLKLRTAIAEKVKSPVLAKCYYGLGFVYCEQGDNAASERFYLKTLDVASPTDWIYQQSKTNLLELYRSLNQPEKIKLLHQRLGGNLD